MACTLYLFRGLCGGLLRRGELRPVFLQQRLLFTREERRLVALFEFRISGRIFLTKSFRITQLVVGERFLVARFAAVRQLGLTRPFVGQVIRQLLGGHNLLAVRGDEIFLALLVRVANETFLLDFRLVVRPGERFARGQPHLTVRSDRLGREPVSAAHDLELLAVGVDVLAVFVGLANLAELVEPESVRQRFELLFGTPAKSLVGIDDLLIGGLRKLLPVESGLLFGILRIAHDGGRQFVSVGVFSPKSDLTGRRRRVEGLADELADAVFLNVSLRLFRGAEAGLLRVDKEDTVRRRNLHQTLHGLSEPGRNLGIHRQQHGAARAVRVERRGHLRVERLGRFRHRRLHRGLLLHLLQLRTGFIETKSQHVLLHLRRSIVDLLFEVGNLGLLERDRVGRRRLRLLELLRVVGRLRNAENLVEKVALRCLRHLRSARPVTEIFFVPAVRVRAPMIESIAAAVAAIVDFERDPRVVNRVAQEPLLVVLAAELRHHIDLPQAVGFLVGRVARIERAQFGAAVTGQRRFAHSDCRHRRNFVFRPAGLPQNALKLVLRICDLALRLLHRLLRGLRSLSV